MPGYGTAFRPQSSERRLRKGSSGGRTLTARDAHWRKRFPFHSVFFSSAPKGSLPRTLPLCLTCGVKSEWLSSSFPPSQGKAQGLHSPHCVFGFVPDEEEPGASVVCTRNREETPLAHWPASTWLKQKN